MVVGGNSDAALRRAPTWGDGWYGFNVDGIDAVARPGRALHELCGEAGRDPSALRVAVALSQPADREELAAAGVDELVLVEGPPEDPADAAPGPPRSPGASARSGTSSGRRRGRGRRWCRPPPRPERLVVVGLDRHAGRGVLHDPDAPAMDEIVKVAVRHAGRVEDVVGDVEAVLRAQPGAHLLRLVAVQLVDESLDLGRLVVLEPVAPHHGRLVLVQCVRPLRSAALCTCRGGVWNVA